MAATYLIKEENRDDGCFLAAIILLSLCPATGSGCGPGELNQFTDSLWAGRSGDRIPVGARFSAPVQTGPVVHPALHVRGNGNLSRE